jgi:hypothetical protein
MDQGKPIASGRCFGPHRLPSCQLLILPLLVLLREHRVQWMRPNVLQESLVAIVVEAGFDHTMSR